MPTTRSMTRKVSTELQTRSQIVSTPEVSQPPSVADPACCYPLSSTGKRLCRDWSISGETLLECTSVMCTLSYGLVAIFGALLYYRNQLSGFPYMALLLIDLGFKDTGYLIALVLMLARNWLVICVCMMSVVFFTHLGVLAVFLECPVGILWKTS